MRVCVCFVCVACSQYVFAMLPFCLSFDYLQTNSCTHSCVYHVCVCVHALHECMCVLNRVCLLCVCQCLCSLPTEGPCNYAWTPSSTAEDCREPSRVPRPTRGTSVFLTPSRLESHPDAAGIKCHSFRAYFTTLLLNSGSAHLAFLSFTHVCRSDNDMASSLESVVSVWTVTLFCL